MVCRGPWLESASFSSWDITSLAFLSFDLGKRHHLLLYPRPIETVLARLFLASSKRFAQRFPPPQYSFAALMSSFCDRILKKSGGEGMGQTRVRRTKTPLGMR